MKRIDTPTKVTDKFGAGKHGFTNGNPTTGIKATALDESWFDHIQEEIARVVESTGVPLAAGSYDQLKIAIETMIAAAVSGLPPADTLPVGSILPCPSTTPWTGFYLADGSLLTRADDPDLWAYANGSGNIIDEVDWALATSGSFSRGDGATTFRLPDYRGVGLRGFDGGRGLDAGRVFGTYQADDFKSHSHGVWGSAVLGANGAAVRVLSTSSTADQSGLSGGTETRMKNTALNFCIKY